jgi:hypothetical protein
MAHDMELPDIENLITAAELHGQESEPDHEVGDLQDVLRTCWRLMSGDQRRMAYEAHMDLLNQFE